MKEIAKSEAVDTLMIFGRLLGMEPAEIKKRVEKTKKQIRPPDFDDKSIRGRAAKKLAGSKIIDDGSRPGTASRFALENIPEPFKKTRIETLMKIMASEHTSGMNRWQLHGEYPKQSWDHDLPAAGAQSGSSYETLLGMQLLNPTDLFGNRAAEQEGLLVAAFMVYGGNHTFVETLPLFQAVSDDREFTVKVTEADKKKLVQTI